MPTPAPTQPADPAPATQTGDGKPAEPTPVAPPAAATTPDLSKLSGEELSKVLENPELFKLPRIAELLDAQKQFKKLQSEQEKANEQSLVEQKKFEELASQRGAENATLKQQLETFTINQALTGKLLPEGVVDLDGALKLIDRSKVSVGDDGIVSGLEDAVAALKTDKGYLFKEGAPAAVGAPTNPNNGGNQPGTPAKFKRSQITAAFYSEHKAEIDEAYGKGLIEDDGPAPAAY